MIKKKLLLLAWCGILGASIVACGDSKSDKETPKKEASEQKEEEPAEETEEPEEVPEIEEEEPDESENIALHGQVLDHKEIDLSTQDNESQGWGIGPDRDEYNRPVDCINYQEQYKDYNADFIVPTEDPAKEKILYLTFDEGYENGYTEKILDTLKEKDAKAVFFVTGPYVKEAPDLVQRMIDEGHIVGNHTQNHPVGGITTLENADAMQKELTDVHETVKEKYDYDMYLFRPPEGVFSNLSLAATSNLGYRSVLWSFAHRDYEPEDQPDPGEALENCKQKLCPGAIYLLHAISSTNTEILGDLIDYAREEGYEIGDYAEYVETLK